MDIGPNASVKPPQLGAPTRRSVVAPVDWLRALLTIRSQLVAGHPAIYLSLVLLTAVAGFGYRFRSDSIFACQASGYSADRYLAYCNGGHYADYEHGAFRFDLEPSLKTSIEEANVLFFGNSRLQIGFSAPETAKWFSAASIRYYFMGFIYFENVNFTESMLREYRPKASVYIINVDEFFVPTLTDVATTVLHDPAARRRYEIKKLWQGVHARVCQAVPRACANRFALFRSRSTGEYTVLGTGQEKSGTVSYDPAVDAEEVKSSIAIGKEFLTQFGEGKCVILTMVPFAGTKIGDARAIAKGLGLKLVAPEIPDGLRMFDGVHLDAPSAERWSLAFLQAAGPVIQSCLARQDASAR